MIDGKGQAEQIDQFGEPLGIKFAGAGFLFKLLHNFGAFCGVNWSSFGPGHVFLKFSQWRDTPFL